MRPAMRMNRDLEYSLNRQHPIDWSDNTALYDLSPQLLKELSRDECDQVAASIRSFMVANVMRSGGHLGGNLGVVELTVALHRVFDSPSDPIIFDIGHQSYVHKIITGRAKEFGNLRRFGGMSGFPSRAESLHDHLENSHSSTALAWALGMTLGTSANERSPRPIVVIGDGALTGGVAFEALNAIGVRQSPVLVVLNDNGRSYAGTTSRLTMGDPYDLEDWAGQRNVQGYFESLGFSYIGPVDGHDLDSLEASLRTAKAVHGPVVAHVRTKKGLGWKPAMDDEVMRQHQVAGLALAATNTQPVLPLSAQSWG